MDFGLPISMIEKWIDVITDPLGLAGFALFLVFVLLRPKRTAWLQVIFVSMAVAALIGGFALAYHGYQPTRDETKGRAETQPERAQPPGRQKGAIHAWTHEEKSPVVITQSGDVTITFNEGPPEEQKKISARLRDIQQTLDSIGKDVASIERREISLRLRAMNAMTELLEVAISGGYDIPSSVQTDLQEVLTEVQVEVPQAIGADDLDKARTIAWNATVLIFAVVREGVGLAVPKAEDLLELAIEALDTGELDEAAALLSEVEGMLPPSPPILLD